MPRRHANPRAALLAALFGAIATLALSWLAMPLPAGNAWHGPPTTEELGVFAAADGKLYQISRGRNPWHTAVTYWHMQMSGISFAIPTADYEARKFDFRKLPSHLRPDSLSDLNMQAWYHATGWPFAAFACSVHWRQQVSNSNITYTVRGGLQLPRDSAFNPRALPLTPLWPGLVANLLLSTGLAMALLSAAGALRRRERVRRGLCPRCRYPRTSLPSDAPCPECGEASLRE